MLLPFMKFYYVPVNIFLFIDKKKKLNIFSLPVTPVGQILLDSLPFFSTSTLDIFVEIQLFTFINN